MIKMFQDHLNKEIFYQIKCCLFEEVKYMVQDYECVIALWHTLDQKNL